MTKTLDRRTAPISNINNRIHGKRRSEIEHAPLLPVFSGLCLLTCYFTLQCYRVYIGDRIKSTVDVVPEITACIAVVIFIILGLKKYLAQRFESSHIDQLPSLMMCISAMIYTASWQGPEPDEQISLVFATWTIIAFSGLQVAKMSGFKLLILDSIPPFMACVSVVFHTFPEFTRLHQLGHLTSVGEVLPGMLAYLAMTCYTASRMASFIVGHCFGPYVDLLPGGVACSSILSSSWILTSKMPSLDCLPLYLALCVILFYMSSEHTRLNLPPNLFPMEQFSLLLVTMIFFCYSAGFVTHKKGNSLLPMDKKQI